MKIVIIGGTGLIGTKTAANLRRGGHEVIAASPKSGVNTITGEGLDAALAGAQVVIDLANSPSFEDRPHSAPGRPRGRRRLAQDRREQHHRRGPQRGHGRHASGDRPRQLALI